MSAAQMPPVGGPTAHVLPPIRGGGGVGARRGGRGMGRFWIILVVLAVLLLLINPWLTNFLVNLWWFHDVGYQSVFVRSLQAQIVLGVAGAVVAFIALRGAVAVVAGLARRAGRGDHYARGVRLIATLVSLALAAMLGVGLSSNWFVYLLALHAVPFGTTDPMFHQDIALYVFRLPAWTDALGWLGGLLLWVGLVALVVMWGIDLRTRLSVNVATSTQGGVAVHYPQLGGSVSLASFQPYRRLMAIWLAAVAVLLAVANWVARYSTVASPEGRIAGPGYVATHITLPALALMTFVSLLLAVILLLSALRGNRWRWLVIAPAVWVVLWLVSLAILPGVVQALVVAPAELQQQEPYIARDIQMTRQAFNLSSVVTHDFPATTITAQIVQSNRPTIDNLRILDRAPFLTASKQKQEIRSYYDFSDAQLDRYSIDGTQRQMLVAAREINIGNLPSSAQTWQNTYLTYTHGFGVVVAPVNQVDTDGSPLYWVKDIPPHANPAVPQASQLPTVSQPRIYFGMETTNPVFVDTNAPEFDHSTANQEYYGRYNGTAGIPLGGLLQRAVWVSYFADPINVGTSSYLTAQTRVLLHRSVLDRVQTIAPFLTIDSAPYMVLLPNGHLMWLLDAYTTSDQYPYSALTTMAGTPTGGDLSSVAQAGGAPQINYLRNSIKITIDPYNGTVQFYLVDPTDPIARAISGSFPGLIHPLSAMPQALLSHLRVPTILFDTQSNVYTLYHMTDPQVFYNQEDKWDLPTDASGNTLDSYYNVTRLPGGQHEEFVLMRPFTPLAKPNMIALMVARCDAPHYGQIVTYRLPIGQQVLGPAQFNANIDQNSTMSADITLWNQQGSQVIRGNVIVVPLGAGLLYLEPIYLQSSSNPIPQLRKIVVYANGQLVWDDTLDAALNDIFGSGVTVVHTTTPPTVLPPAAGAQPDSTLKGAQTDLRSIASHLTAAEQAIARGDYVTYGREMQTIRSILAHALAPAPAHK